MFLAKDCTLLEINPIAEDAGGTGTRLADEFIGGGL